MAAYPDVRFLLSAHDPAHFCPDRGAEVAFAGRSNAGKSSAVNAITGRKELARTSKMPGRTQLVNFFELTAGQRLVDLPGYGFAKVPPAVQQHWRALMSAYFEQRQSLAGLIVVVDGRRGIGPHDLQMLDYAAARGRPLHVLLSKCDKLSRAEAARALREAAAAVAGRASVQLFSAVSREGVDAARKVMDGMLAALPGT